MTEKSSIDISAAGGFNNERRAALLAVIDELRELGIGDDNISLPQASTQSKLADSDVL